MIRANPRYLLRMTHHKAWTKQWLKLNTSFATPDCIVFISSFMKLVEWLQESCPLNKRIVIKPINLSRSRGVRILERLESGEFRSADSEPQYLDTILREVLAEVGGGRGRMWLVEEYVEPIPKDLAELCFDGNFNPLVRIIMQDGDFHLGELHIPTCASQGRGSLQGGARRLVCDYRGMLLQERPGGLDDHPWAVEQYGTKIDVTNRVLPHFQDLIERIRTEIVPRMCPKGYFAFDGCYRDTSKGVEFVCIEIEQRPNIKNLLKFTGLRNPEP